MKILMLGKFYPIRGGVEKVMWDLTRGISARGVGCDMLCAMLPGDCVDKADERLVEAEDSWPRVLRFNDHGRCICVKAYRKVAATMISPAMIFWLRKHQREYDIIHVHHPDPMACLALWLSGYKGRVILHWHSDILKQKGLLTFYRPLQDWLIRRAEKIVGTTPVYVTQSKDLKNVQDNVTNLPIGVEDTIRSGGQHEFDTNRLITVFSLGRLVTYKGYQYLVEAARYLPDNYRIVIGGKGSLKDELQAQVDALPKTGCASVELKGYLSDEQSHELFNSCDVFCLSSVMKTEAFGIVQIEAMSCGKPVVATHIPESGVDWVNEDGVSGLNVPICDPKALAEAIMAITCDSATYGRYAAGARARYEKLFTFDGMINRCLKLYEA